METTAGRGSARPTVGRSAEKRSSGGAGRDELGCRGHRPLDSMACGAPCKDQPTCRSDRRAIGHGTGEGGEVTAHEGLERRTKDLVKGFEALVIDTASSWRSLAPEATSTAGQSSPAIALSRLGRKQMVLRGFKSAAPFRRTTGVTAQPRRAHRGCRRPRPTGRPGDGKGGIGPRRTGARVWVDAGDRPRIAHGCVHVSPDKWRRRESAPSTGLGERGRDQSGGRMGDRTAGESTRIRSDTRGFGSYVGRRGELAAYHILWWTSIVCVS